MATSALPGGVEQLWGGIANFLAVIFLLAAASRAALFALGSYFLSVVAFAAGNALLLSVACSIQYRQWSPLFWHSQNSVPERASYGTEYAFGAQKGFLWYATRFQRRAVLKTGFYGTEGIFGTGNALDGHTLQGLQDTLRAHPKRRIRAVRHRIDNHSQIRERGGGQPDTVDFHSPDESHRPDQ